MIVDDKGNVFEDRRKNKVDRRDAIGGTNGKMAERRKNDRRRPASEEKNKEVNR
ncbi:MAG: hypothetical protein HFJ32_02875 [Clostridia bacterium]|jgi:hypothetical protein|nr:hypothetical protein [Clostridia bacterium]